ncbi:MAG: Calx-beta domain-containing protein, partial [Lachnospirales bacterium]
MSKKFKRFLAFILAFVISIPNVVFAAENNFIYVPEIDIEDEVKSGNLFYLSSSEVEMNENSDGHYLVKIGRGGDISKDASVLVKMADYTAKYGKDYKVYLYNGGFFNEASSDKDALSVIEMIEGEDYTEFEVGDNEELAKEIEDGTISGSAIAVAAAEGVNEAVAVNKALKGEDNNDYIKAAESVEVIEAEIVENTEVESETEDITDENTSDEYDINTLAGARQAFTGIVSDRTKQKASVDIVDQFAELQAYQDVADTISDAMVSAKLKVEFESGESEKYIEIVPIDNDESDSDRVFNITIGDPEGEFTVSAYSTAVCKILDDEEKVKAKISFASTMVTPDTGKDYATVTLTREGGINDLVSVMLKSKSGTAMSGRDFSPVSAEVVFPFGVTERTVDIPVNTEYITEESDFDIYIDTPVSCEIGDVSQTKVLLYPSATDNEESEDDINLDVEVDADNVVSALMSETTYKSNQRVYFPRIYTNNSNTRDVYKSYKFKDDCEVEGDYGWYIRPTDDEKYAEVTFGINNESIKDRYDVNGLTFSFRGHYAAHPHDGTAYVGFLVSQMGPYGYPYTSSDYQYTGGSTGWTERTVYTTYGNVRGAKIRAEDDKGSGRD